MILSKLLKKIKKQHMPACYFTRKQMMKKGHFYKFIKKEVLDEGNTLIYVDKAFIAPEECLFHGMA